jgi:hypothetical protein
LFPEKITIGVRSPKKYYLTDVMQFILLLIISKDNWETCLFHSVKLNFHLSLLECSEAIVGDMKPNQSGVVMTSSEEGAIENLFQTEQSSNEEPLISRIFIEPPRSQASHQILFQMKWINAL